MKRLLPLLFLCSTLSAQSLENPSDYLKNLKTIQKETKAAGEKLYMVLDVAGEVADSCDLFKLIDSILEFYIYTIERIESLENQAKE